MDFAHLGSDNNGGFSLENTAEANKQRCYGFGFLKQERAVNEEDLRGFKVAKTSPFSNACSEGHQQMLSFSSPSSHPITLSYYQHATNAIFGRNAGYGCTGGMIGGSLQGVRGPFTPSQWMELEQQALIFKYITANVPVPSYLLNPIRKAFESAGFSLFRSNALGWGGFQLGFSNDPEPGRCRRTDGKKWRCSRDAVADQKYCERHMNRGRHRSRKPVEGQSGHSASAATTTANGKLLPIASASSTPSVVAAGGVSDALGLSHHLADLQPSAMATLNRSLLDKENSNGVCRHTTILPMASPKVGPKDNDQNAILESSREEFGLVCSDSLLNPLNSSSSLVNNHSNKPQHHPLRQFIDDWPKTQLSISIPIATSDFMSSTSSPRNEKLTASPSRLSRELEMGLGVGPIALDRSQRQTNWVPISWEPSIGGPLGEVLHTSTGECQNTRPLNLIDSWDNSPKLASSPTGVLQRGSFGSLSNSSASSPRTESYNPGLMNPSLPAL